MGSIGRVCSHLGMFAAALIVAMWLASGSGPMSAAADERERGHEHRGEDGHRSLDRDALLGGGDVRFGIDIEPGGAAIIADWQSHDAIFINAEGRYRELDFELSHQHGGLSIPAEGHVVLESLSGHYYLVDASGDIREFGELE